MEIWWWHEGCNMVLKMYNIMALGRIFHVTINSLIYSNNEGRKNLENPELNKNHLLSVEPWYLFHQIHACSCLHCYHQAGDS